LVNEIFDKESTSYYHHYRLVHTEDQSKTIEGLELIFIEIPKFKLKNIADMKLFVLWMRYMSEIENGQEMIDQQLLDELNSVPEIAQALELTKESAYTKAELEAYDKYWDTIRTEKTLIVDAEAKGEKRGEQKGEQIGLQKGELIGLEKGEQIGIQKGELKKQTEVVLKCFENDISITLIANITQLTEEEVIKILREHGKME
jgi:predicted transposase/invertase (TIGR01784 family)